MNGNNLLKSIHRFGLTAEDICRNTLGVDIGQIRETVLLSPGWVPERLFSAAEIEECVSASPLFQYKIWDVRRGGRCATYVRCGFGAPVVMDAVLLFGLTGRCNRMLFVSSVGAVSEEMEIGDLLAPEYSAAGDGAGRYLEEDFLRDTFGERQYPERALFARLVDAARAACAKHSVRFHIGRTFCTDTIAAQFGHIDRIVQMGYDSLDMESAAAFKAANLLQIPIAALLNVSDNSAAGKSLMTRRSDEEISRRRFVSREVMANILTELL